MKRQREPGVSQLIAEKTVSVCSRWTLQAAFGVHTMVDSSAIDREVSA